MNALRWKLRRKLRKILRRRNLWGYYVEFELALRTLFRGDPPAPRFVVYAQGRTGSRLLCELLGSHSKIHCDFEILADPVSKNPRPLRRAVQDSHRRSVTTRRRACAPGSPAPRAWRNPGISARAGPAAERPADSLSPRC